MIEFPHSATPTAESRIAGLLSAGAGPTLIEHLRDLHGQHQPSKRRISSAAFRDLTAGVASAGGYLIGTKQQPLEQLLLRFSIFAEGGLNIITGLDGPVTIPRVTTVPTASWLPQDGTALTESQSVFGQIALGPKFVASYTEISRPLLLQSSAEAIAGAQAGESTSRAIDTAILAGTGVSGQPTGIVNTSGIGTQSGSSLAAAGLRAMRKAVLNAGAREDRLMWIADPATQELLGSREFSAGSGRPLWDDGKILGRPAVATSLAPAATLILGDFSRVTVSVFDAAGIELEHDPYTNFKSGVSAFRLIVPVDVAVSPAAAFCVATSIT